VCADRRVCIVGAGFTGLAAATDLLSTGAGVQVVEQGERPGGMAGGFREPGWRSSLEYTYHHWFSTDLAFRDYAAKWDAAGDLILKRPLTVVETKESGFVRLDSPCSLLQYPDIGPLDRVRLAAVLLYLRGTRQWRHLERITAREWCGRWMGSGTYEAIWRPQLISKFGAEWEPGISMAFLWARLHVRSAELGTVNGGFQAMADKAERHLLQSGAIVSRNVSDTLVRPAHNGSWRVRISGQWHEFDAVIVAASPLTLRAIASAANPGFCEQIYSRPYLGARTMILSLNRPLGNSGAYWYSLRPRDDSPFTVVVEHTNFVPPEAFAGEHIVYLCKYLDPDSPEWDRDESTLLSSALECIQRINPEVGAGNINRRWIFDYEYAQPIRGLNASKDIPPLQVPACRGLFHASMAHIYPWDRGTNYALALGGKAANACSEYLRGL
jgi:protoporphyrinogen oxidase